MFNSYWKYWKKKKTIHYVSSTHNIDTVLEKKYFPDIEFVRNGNNKYYRDKCWQKKNQHWKYKAKKRKFAKYRKFIMKKIMKWLLHKGAAATIKILSWVI